MVKKEEVKTILIIGIAGGLAQLTAKKLARKYPGARIVGVDTRGPGKNLNVKNLTFIQIRYTRSSFEALFRNNVFDLVYHLGRIPNTILLIEGLEKKRVKFNVIGTNLILDLCLKFMVKKVVVLSTSYVYGAISDNPVFICEDDPLRASLKYPDLHDVVEMDRISSNWMWKNRDSIKTIILRPCHIVGPNINNTINQYLKSDYVPVPMDFNPMFQFIDEDDMARVLTVGVEKLPTGVYNVAPDEYVSILQAKKIIGSSGFRIPFFLLGSVAGIVRKFGNFMPEYLVDYLKFACLIDNSSMKKYLGKDFFRHDTKKTLKRLSG
ncbi:MAG: NAD-dependent epimerase/dehydratase family protein [Bacteriovoracaceae bacterium]|nr:NAD-dependent epimerase/dehydratase family protein [Bacteriovoracaceae bacterium]